MMSKESRECCAERWCGIALELTFRARPPTEMPSEFDPDDFRTLQFPRHARHGVNRISSANTDAQHTHASSIWRV